MNQDKKCCLNCKNRSRRRGFSCKFYYCIAPDYKDWLRDPKLWLSIPPEQEGWYWWRQCNLVNGSPLEIRDNGKEFVAFVLSTWIPIKQLVGQFQGPITPEGG